MQARADSHISNGTDIACWMRDGHDELHFLRGIFKRQTAQCLAWNVAAVERTTIYFADYSLTVPGSPTPCQDLLVALRCSLHSSLPFPCTPQMIRRPARSLSTPVAAATA